MSITRGTDINKQIIDYYENEMNLQAPIFTELIKRSGNVEFDMNN